MVRFAMLACPEGGNFVGLCGGVAFVASGDCWLIVGWCSCSSCLTQLLAALTSPASRFAVGFFETHMNMKLKLKW